MGFATSKFQKTSNINKIIGGVVFQKIADFSDFFEQNSEKSHLRRWKWS